MEFVGRIAHRGERKPIQVARYFDEAALRNGHRDTCSRGGVVAVIIKAIAAIAKVLPPHTVASRVSAIAGGSLTPCHKAGQVNASAYGCNRPVLWVDYYRGSH